MRKLCLKNTLHWKIGIEYTRIIKYILGEGHNVNYILSKNLIKDIVLTISNIIKSQKLKTTNIFIVGQLWDIILKLTIFCIMSQKIAEKKSYFRSI